jgi:hypothetical protein
LHGFVLKKKRVNSPSNSNKITLFYYIIAIEYYLKTTTERSKMRKSHCTWNIKLYKLIKIEGEKQREQGSKYFMLLLLTANKRVSEEN